MSENKEFRVFGPPGCGKTTYLAKKIDATAAARGSNALLVASFTKTAAAEIASRGIPVAKEQVGTLHALAWKTIERPGVVEDKIPEWNSRYPSAALSGGHTSEDAAAEVFRSGSPGDQVMSQIETLRARMVPVDQWPVSCQSFYKNWVAFKQEHDVIDFTDMIDLAIDKGGPAPGNPKVGFFDEVQDFTPLELALVRSWGSHMDRVVLAGDDDQCIYGFKGSSPDAFLNPPLPDEDKHFLTQSYRVPANVQKVAQHWIEGVSQREEKTYLPRDEEGIVRLANHRHNLPDPLVNEIVSKVDEGKEVMVLASCSFMLDKIKHRLRRVGMPFHNPYRSGRGDWNPLTPGRGVSSAERLLAYLIMDEEMFGEASRLWTGGDVKRWTSAVKKQGIFRRGAASAIGQLPDRELSYEDVASLFSNEDELEQAVQPDIEWFERNLLSASRQPMQFPLNVVRKRGPQALIDTPRVVLGTIHSVKGAQADVVYLFPDLSKAAMLEWNGQRGPEARDSIIRQMYVGMTRAKEELVVCQGASMLAVPARRLMAGLVEGDD